MTNGYRARQVPISVAMTARVRTIRHYHQVLCTLGDTFADMVPSAGNSIRKVTEFTKRFRLEPPSRDINFLTPEEIDRVLKELESSGWGRDRTAYLRL